MSNNELVVQEIAGRDPSAMDFIFAPESNWELDLFISNGKSVRARSEQLPIKKINSDKKTIP